MSYQLASVIFLNSSFFQIREYISGDIHILIDLHIPIRNLTHVFWQNILSLNI